MKYPQVLNKYHGNIPPDAVNIMRGSPYGNNFVIGVHGNRDEVCDLFEAEQLPHMDVEPLRGKLLVCCCSPARCHGHSIIKKLEATNPMAKTKTIKVTLSRTIGLPDYGSVRLEVSEEVELEAKDKSDKVYLQTLNTLKKRIAKEVKKIKP